MKAMIWQPVKAADFSHKRRKAAFGIALFGLFTLFSHSIYAKEAVSVRQKASQGLQTVNNTIQKCMSELTALEQDKGFDNTLEKVLANAGQKTFDIAGAVEQIKQSAGKEIDLSPAELQVCLESYHAQAQLPSRTQPDMIQSLLSTAVKSTSGGYPDCSGACPNPDGPGGQCCDGSSVCASSCSDDGNDCSASCEPKLCFPGEATVLLKTGATKKMQELVIGDSIQVVRNDGTLGFEEVFLMTHNNADTMGSYLKISLSSGSILILSPRHFVPTSQNSDQSWTNRIMKGADELKPGDRIWHQANNGTMAMAKISSIQNVASTGAYNPLTASGSVVVDGVVASTHSDWFLDGLVSADMQDKVYQTMFSPVHGIYQIIGPRWMKRITSDWGVVDSVRLATSNPVAAVISLMMFFASGFVVFNAIRKLWNRREAHALTNNVTA